MTNPPAQSLLVHVVSHTHWDREWYHPADRFLQRLVPLIDALLEDRDDVAPFLLDGQAIVLEDYLGVRPGQREAVRMRLHEGSLEAGPWYVLADELIPSGESLVRNLLAGRALLEGLGAAAPQVLYSPDAFGHPAMLPAIAAGFGMPLIVLWRGYGGALHARGDLARWSAPDGSSVLLYHLPPDGYELGSSLPLDEEGSSARWRALRDVLAPRATVGHALLLNGADHHARQPGRARAVALLAAAARPAEVHLASLGDFASAIVAGAAARPAIPEVRGELRDSYGYTWTLQGTFATRSALKRRAALAERALLRHTEPWVALAERVRATSRGALVRAAWKTLLKCQPHDTLCGCSVDLVARAMAARLEQVEAQSAGLREDALFDLIGYDAVATRTSTSVWSSAVVVCNPCARPRGGVAEIDVVVVRDHVRVGPGSGAGEAMPSGESPPDWTLGASVPVQRLRSERRHDRVESPLHYPWDDFVESTRALAWVPRIEAYGTRSFPLLHDDGAGIAVAPDQVRCDGLAMSNAALRVEADARGGIRLLTSDGVRSVSSLLSIESQTDCGDLYTPSLRGVPRFAEFANPRVELRGALRATLCVQWRVELFDELRMLVPRAATGMVRLTLDAGAKFLRVDIDGDNGLTDHRLRLRVATDVADAELFADAAFGVVRREPIVAPPASAEMPPPTAPLARYVTLATRHHGATIYSDGLGEYEAYPDGTVALTLLRAVGELSRNDLPERPGHAGWPASTPEAQQPGPFSGRFALLLHGTRDEGTIGEIERTADDVLHPLVGRTVRSATAIAVSTMGATLEGDGLALSTIKTSEDGAWLVLRCVNLLERDVAGSWTLGAPASEARASRLDETPAELLGIQGNRIVFVAPARAIVTVLAR